MPFVAPEDVGTTRRRSLTAHRRLKAWERTGGVCVVCESPIDGIRERWIVEHIRALELGGADDLSNMGPAHEACGRTKTRDDHSRTAHAKRQKISHLGVAVTPRPVPGSRSTPFKRTVNGRVILREPPTSHAASAVEAPRPPRVRPSKKDGGDPSPRPDPGCAATALGSNWNKHRTHEVAAVFDSARDVSPQDTYRTDAGPTGRSLPALPRQLDFLFEDRLLFEGEDPQQYDVLLRELVQELGPRSALEAIWIKDVVDLIWEAKRFRGWKQQILSQARLEAIKSLLFPVIVANDQEPRLILGANPEAEAAALALGWIQGDKKAAASCEKLLRARGLTATDITAAAFHQALPEIERIDRMAAAADARRDTLLREIERKRASLGQPLQAAADDILDVEPAETG
ncbi:HNH endonuclease signature motif containing protein [Methylobacterium tarhaniae]|uniref:HNH endonuclease signature motif containing protein n=1 Tax=Methylobacterium tarhaniae TaxID=1187852 RepID=UPI003D07DE1C